MLTRIKIYFQLLVNQSVSKNSETTNRMIFTETKILVHFYKNSRTSSSFSMTLADFHDFPGLENGLTKFHDFPWLSRKMVTLCRFCISWLVTSTRLPICKILCWRAVRSLHHLEASLETNTHTLDWRQLTGHIMLRPVFSMNSLRRRRCCKSIANCNKSHISAGGSWSLAAQHLQRLTN